MPEWVLTFFLHDGQGSQDVKLPIGQKDTESKISWDKSWTLRNMSHRSLSRTCPDLLYLFVLQNTEFRCLAAIWNCKTKVLNDHHKYVVSHHGSRTLSRHEKMSKKVVCIITALSPGTVKFVTRLGLLKDSKIFMNISINIGKVFTELSSNFYLECATSFENKSCGYS